MPWVMIKKVKAVIAVIDLRACTITAEAHAVERPLPDLGSIWFQRHLNMHHTHRQLVEQALQKRQETRSHNFRAAAALDSQHSRRCLGQGHSAVACVTSRGPTARAEAAHPRQGAPQGTQARAHQREHATSGVLLANTCK